MIADSSIFLHPGQKRIIKELLTRPVRYNTINAPRQSGKSVLGRELVNYFAFSFEEYEKQILHPKFRTKECKILWASPVIAQARKVYKEIAKAWAPILVYSNKTERELITKNGTTVHFVGMDKADNIRSENYNYMICDEFAFFKDGVFDMVLRPMLLVQGKMVFFISTPKGLNEFYKLHQKGVSDQFLNYKYAFMDYTENPYADMEEIEDARQNLPLAIFEQEYLGKFVGTGSSVFGDFERLMILDKWSEPIPTMEYYNGNDIAKQKDWTVSTTIDKNHKVANILRMRQMNWQEIINGIINDLSKYNSYALMEVNGVGDPIYDLVKNKYEQLQPFITTNASKQMIISNLIASCNVGSLKLPSKELCPALHEEMNMFTFDYSKERRQIVYHAREGYHDDCIISLALSNMQYRRFSGEI